MRVLSLLYLATTLGCGPLNAMSDIYAPDMPTKASPRARAHVSTGDPESLNQKSRPEESHPEWTD